MDKLASYLEYLANNSTAYAEYFWWKKYYVAHNLEGMSYSEDEDTRRAIDAIPEKLNPFCNFCRALNGELKPKRTYKSLDHFWNANSGCRVLQGRWQSGYPHPVRPGDRLIRLEP